MPALTRQNVNSDALDILNFFLLPSRRFFCFPLDSAALSDSWRALILIIALHQYGFLFFFPLFFFVCSPLVRWSLFCLNHGYASAGNQLELCVFGTTGYFPGLHVCTTNLFFACLLQGLVETPHSASRCLMYWESVGRAPLTLPGIAPR